MIIRLNQICFLTLKTHTVVAQLAFPLLLEHRFCLQQHKGYLSTQNADTAANAATFNTASSLVPVRVGFVKKPT